MSIRFEWDEEKANLNYKKHGVSFETASNVFLDENRIEIYDELHSVNEERYVTIGMANDILFVVYTDRSVNIRIISARKATNQERRLYYDHTV